MRLAFSVFFVALLNSSITNAEIFQKDKFNPNYEQLHWVLPTCMGRPQMSTDFNCYLGVSGQKPAQHAILPGFHFYDNETHHTSRPRCETPTAETPVPQAGFLMLSALIGLLAFRRK